MEHLPWDGDLGYLDGDIAAVVRHFRADLDLFLLQVRQRLLLDHSGQSQHPHEVCEIVGQCMKLKPDGL